MSSSSSLPLPALPSLVERYLASLRARGYAALTVAHERIYLGQLVDWLVARGIEDVRRVTPQVVEDYRRALAAHRYRRSRAPRARWRALTPRGRHARLLLVCRFLRFLVAEHVLLADPTAALVVAAPRRQLPRRVLGESQVRRLLAAADLRTPWGIRARAILELVYSSGLRRAEVAALDVHDLDLTSGTVTVRRGKGGKGRVVPLGQAAADALLRYLEEVRPLWLTSPAVTALFLAAGVGRRGHRLSAASIHLTVRAAARSAGLGRVAPHALRHAMATHLVRAGAGVRHVQEILGHANVETTEIYTHVAVRDLARAHARSHPRGRARGTK